MLRFLAPVFVCAGIACAAPSTVTPESIVETYTAVARNQRGAMNGATMDIQIEAKLPKLNKQGRLHALRRISSLGRISYERIQFEGDGTIKSNVIARYLAAETQAAAGDEAQSLAVMPANYKFRYKGSIASGGQRMYIFQITPRKRRQGLFKGDLWIDAATYLPVQESGRLVKTPSIFLKKIAFVRKYEIRDGIAVPREIESVVETRLVGKAELKVDFSNFSREEKQASIPVAEDVSGGSGDGN